jgi:hypothetical protein
MGKKKSWKEARRHARAISHRLDLEQRAARRTPKWRTVLLALGFPGFTRRWLKRWEERHAKALAVSLKKTTHFIIEEDRKAVRPKKPYTMRKGPQPLPEADREALTEQVGFAMATGPDLMMAPDRPVPPENVNARTGKP